ncbi:MAG: sulfatase-like hydrolase/transferase [Bacteroidia bacterium]|nr:sulfatase-like hydrolase/transferase [Bacteroidia bacterium]
MKVHLTWLYGALKRLGVLILLYSLCRLLFLLVNYSFFRGISASDYFSVFGAGFLFDLSAIVMINSLYLAGVLLPSPIRTNKTYKKILRWLYILPNSFFLLFNVMDAGYYPFTLHRSTMEIITFATGKVDFLTLLPSLIAGYWFLPLLWILMVWVLSFTDRKIIFLPSASLPSSRYRLIHFALFIVFSSMALLAYRGGFRLRPLHMVDAAAFSDARYSVLVLNTPFNMIKSAETGSLAEVNYMSGEEERKHFNPVHPGDTGAILRRNVIIFILESFSKEYTRAGGRTSFTPFLDSLSEQGLYCLNGFANGKRSIEALPAVTASIPTLMNEPFITSVYGTNAVEGLPVILKKYGYTTSFFHGATNGSMGFDSYAAMAGFDRYYGRTEYAGEQDADGHWGIWDGPFLRRFAEELDKQKEPFLSTLFTLSSHHPYRVPEGMEHSYPEGKYPILRTIRYTDDQLRRFFTENKEKNWFRNSVFVFVADHTGVSDDPYYMHRLGQHSIPILFYSPSDTLKAKVTRISQQADIMPTLLDLLNIPDSYYGYGQSLLKPVSGYAVFHISNEYYLVSDSLILSFNGEQVTTVHNYRRDSLLQGNLVSHESMYRKELTLLKALIQRYNRDMIRNKLRPG